MRIEHLSDYLPAAPGWYRRSSEIGSPGCYFIKISCGFRILAACNLCRVLTIVLTREKFIILVFYFKLWLERKAWIELNELEKKTADFVKLGETNVILLKYFRSKQNKRNSLAQSEIKLYLISLPHCNNEKCQQSTRKITTLLFSIIISLQTFDLRVFIIMPKMMGMVLFNM